MPWGASGTHEVAQHSGTETNARARRCYPGIVTLRPGPDGQRRCGNANLIGAVVAGETYAVTLLPVPEVGNVPLLFAGLARLTTQLASLRRRAP